MGTPIDTTSKEIYDEPGSWGRLSEGWPETAEHVQAKYALCGRGRYIPYGSYVLVGSSTDRPVLRIATQAQLDDLNATFAVLHRVFKESVK